MIGHMIAIFLAMFSGWEFAGALMPVATLAVLIVILPIGLAKEFIEWAWRQ